LLGIFRLKKAKYNKLILKSLIFGQKATRQISEYIYLNQGNLRPQTVNQNELKKIESVICRKGSRLDELGGYGYISRNGDLWELTPKGMGVALTLMPSVSEILPKVASYVLSAVNQFQTMISENPAIEPLINRKERRQRDHSLKKLSQHLTSERFFQFFKDFTNELIVQGLDLDNISDKDFTSMLYGKWFTSNLPRLAADSFRRRGVKP
jgi:hypothetical protein